ncbi:type VI secretion system protein ImpL [Pseudomonas capsici]|uniref:type VI secretion system protein n=1 Tax=Pseudomonas capsici TaxID=2810614 RepID=UPI0021F0D1A2|nr:type VI secretion protein IcmF/TssM N-terminal domain-containing protein [Pseudomonas capsici]MCV4286381.1 type VI secretion system protein ImpL [Pseudomonas capsici]
MTLTMLGWVIGIVVILLILLLCIWWLRTRGGAAIRSFHFAVRQMEKDQGVRDHYQTSWLLMVGDEAQGSQLCSAWNLSPTDKPAWFGRWWSDPEGAVLVVPQSLFMPEEGMKLQGNGWASLLSLLLRIRGQRPLDGVVWNISAADLLDGERAASLGLAARRRFIELLQRLGLSVPVYVVINGMDEIPGFQDLVTALPQDTRQQILGWSSPYDPEMVWQSQWSDTALDSVVQALSEAIVQVGALSGSLSGELSFLPERLKDLRRSLQMLLEPVFQGNAQGEAVRFRGLYFTADQASAPGHETLSASDAPLMQSVFASALWQHRINAERGLAQPVPRLLHLRRRWQRVTAIGALVFGVVWGISMLWVWRYSIDEADELSRLLQEAQRNYVQVNDDSHRQELTRSNVQAFWNVLQNAPRWHFASPVYPSSWFSSLDTRLDGVLRHMSMSHMRQPLHDLLLAQTNELLAITDSDRRSVQEGDDPALWPSYVKARDLVERATRLEQMNNLYSLSLSNQKTPLEDLVPLSNNALGLNLNAGTLHRESFYNRLLAEKSSASLQPLDLLAHRKEVTANFTKLMEKWLVQYYRADNFITAAGYLKLHLERLESSTENDLEELERIKDLIDDLQAVIDLTNATWSRGKGQELVPGYLAMMESVRQSKLLGPQVAQELESQAAQLQHSFKGQWIAQGATSNSLLTQSGSGQLSLQERVSQLHAAINSLLRRDFVASALRQDGRGENGPAQHVDNDGLSIALNHYNSYKLYAREELPNIPAMYRPAMLSTAEEAAADSMWSSLSTHASSSGAQEELRLFDIRTDQALELHKAFIELKHPQLAISLQNYLNRVALADIAVASSMVLEQPLFRDRADISEWDGGKNFGLQLLRATDAQDLKRGLDQQFLVISKITEQHAPAVEWLKTQLQNLPLVSVEEVTRFASLSEEMNKYKAQNPSSSPALITQLLSRDFNDMDENTCLTILQSANVPVSTGQLTQRWLNLQQAALRRCQLLQQQQGTAAWNALASYFNQYLSGRFPFAHDLSAADADPARVQHFLTLIDERLPQAQDGLRNAPSRDRAAAVEFLERLKLARPWLGALLMRDKAGLVGADMEIQWRTDRDSERGADQVINWKLVSGNREISYPGQAQQVLHWNVGQPLSLILRWARDGTQRPVNDPLQSDLRVNGLEAEWQYLGPWSLLRLMSAHVSVQRQPNVDYTEFPLSLEVPVHAPANEENQALMFVRLSLMSQGGKAPLSIQPLPVQAPRSPFGSAPRSVVDAGVYR